MDRFVVRGGSACSSHTTNISLPSAEAAAVNLPRHDITSSNNSSRRMSSGQRQQISLSDHSRTGRSSSDKRKSSQHDEAKENKRKQQQTLNNNSRHGNSTRNPFCAHSQAKVGGIRQDQQPVVYSRDSNTHIHAPTIVSADPVLSVLPPSCSMSMSMPRPTLLSQTSSKVTSVPETSSVTGIRCMGGALQSGHRTSLRPVVLTLRAEDIPLSPPRKRGRVEGESSSSSIGRPNIILSDLDAIVARPRPVPIPVSNLSAEYTTSTATVSATASMTSLPIDPPEVGVNAGMVIELSDDDDIEEGVVVRGEHIEHQKDDEADVWWEEEAEEWAGGRQWAIDASRRKPSLAASTAQQLVLVRQASMSEYVRSTHRLSDRGAYACRNNTSRSNRSSRRGNECGGSVVEEEEEDRALNYDCYQQRMAIGAAERGRGVGGRYNQYGLPIYISPFMISNALPQRFAFMTSISLPGGGDVRGNSSGSSITSRTMSSSSSPCTKIAFDTGGVLFAVGHSDGAVEVFDLDECLYWAQQVNNSEAKGITASVSTSSNNDNASTAPPHPPATDAHREVSPVCRLRTHKHGIDVVDIAWMPRGARTRGEQKSSSSSSNGTSSSNQWAPPLPPTQQQERETEEGGGEECLLAVVFANDPFVYVYDLESSGSTRRPALTLEHAEGRTHGGSNSSLLYVASKHTTTPTRHHVLTGSTRSGCIRQWDLGGSSSSSGSLKRPVWCVCADPRGASHHIGSVVSLHQIHVEGGEVLPPPSTTPTTTIYSTAATMGLGGSSGSSGGGSRKHQQHTSSLSHSMDGMSLLDPYAIPTTTPTTTSAPTPSPPPIPSDVSLLVSVTSRGVLCVWDTAEERCRGNVPAFGSSAAYQPIHLCRVDVMEAAVGGGRGEGSSSNGESCSGGDSDAVISVGYQSSSSNMQARAFVKFLSGTTVCVCLGRVCRIEYVNVHRSSPYQQQPQPQEGLSAVGGVGECRVRSAREVCVLSAGCSPAGTQVLIDVPSASSGGGVSVCVYHDHAMMTTASAPAIGYNGVPPLPLPVHKHQSLTQPQTQSIEVCPVIQTSMLANSSSSSSGGGGSSSERQSEGTVISNVTTHQQQQYSQRHPRFTLPGQVWSISSRWTAVGGGGGRISSTVIECSEDVTPFIGFTPGKSKYIWMQSEAGYTGNSSSKERSGGGGGIDFTSTTDGTASERQRDYLQYLLGGSSSSSTDSSTSIMYTVRSVMRNSIEIYEDYTGPTVQHGYPVMQLRTDLSRCGEGVEKEKEGGGEDWGVDTPPNKHPRNTHFVRPCSSGDSDSGSSDAGTTTTTITSSSISTLAGHPSLHYVACGFADGSVRILSPDIK